MRALSIVAVALAVAWSAPADAGSKRYRKHKPSGEEAGSQRGYYSRSSTVDHRGLCQRDTGRPMESLNLNHKCDREEFWQRFNDLGNSRR